IPHSSLSGESDFAARCVASRVRLIVGTGRVGCGVCRTDQFPIWRQLRSYRSILGSTGYAAVRISSRLNGSTNKFRWLQAAATKVSSLSIASANPATIRICSYRCRLFVQRARSILQQRHKQAPGLSSRLAQLLRRTHAFEIRNRKTSSAPSARQSADEEIQCRASRSRASALDPPWGQRAKRPLLRDLTL